MKNAIIYFLVFIGLQAGTGLVVPILWAVLTGSPDISAAMLITSSVVSGVLAIAIFLLARWTVVSPRWIRTRPWLVLIWSCIAALGALIPSQWIQEFMPELRDFAEKEFAMLLGDRWGYLAIGLLAPLAEEVVFRGAILKALLQKWSPVWAIVVSALFFAIGHFNPVQMPHAFVIGLLLGWMYWRTGSILPGVAYHWANNSAAFIAYQVWPDPDMKLIDIFQGSQLHVLMAVGFSLLILLPAIYQLHLWMRRAE